MQSLPVGWPAQLMRAWLNSTWGHVGCPPARLAGVFSPRIAGQAKESSRVQLQQTSRGARSRDRVAQRGPHPPRGCSCTSALRTCRPRGCPDPGLCLLSRTRPRRKQDEASSVILHAAFLLAGLFCSLDAPLLSVVLLDAERVSLRETYLYLSSRRSELNLGPKVQRPGAPHRSAGRAGARTRSTRRRLGSWGPADAAQAPPARLLLPVAPRAVREAAADEALAALHGAERRGPRPITVALRDVVLREGGHGPTGLLVARVPRAWLIEGRVPPTPNEEHGAGAPRSSPRWCSCSVAN